ncbi:MAG: V-type ATPase subunit [Treponema sp.]|jgi:vacuolar-type H+-ATPase subunit C/Vma6|nr:V-type ATPase subunit [Treponema sp.]
MPGAGERAYAYAKACGIIGKSFLGKRVSRLGGLTRLSELDRLVFPRTSRDLPERELLIDLEKRIIGRSVKQILAIVDSFSKPPELILRLVRSYEYGDIKSVLSAVGGKNTGVPAKSPFFTDLGRFGTVNFSAYPDLNAMLTGTEFEFLLKEDLDSAAEGEASDLQIKLDQQYYTRLWESIRILPKNDSRCIENIIAEEISLKNIVWAMRLRTYYRMSAEEIRGRLVSTPQGGDRRSLAEDAAASLSMALDNYADWEKWKRAGFLNPPRPGEAWTADPRYFQNAASEYLYRLARSCFRRRPLSMDTSSCFIKLKQFEEDILTSVAEGLGMGIPARDVFALLELES